MFLPDVNMWLALTFESHVHHSAGKRWFDSVQDQDVLFCRMTQQGFLRLASNPKAFDQEAVSLLDAWRFYDAFLADPRISFAAEPRGLDIVWRGFTELRSFSPKVWNDAFLAAFALAAGLDLVTFDKAMGQYNGLRHTVLG